MSGSKGPAASSPFVRRDVPHRFAFVADTTTEGSASFVPLDQRIAAFDQDGTLWVEHPMYSQVVYALEHVGDPIKAKPDLAEKEPFKTVASGDRAAMQNMAIDDLLEIVVATQSGMSVEDFTAEVNTWMAASKDPRWKRPYPPHRRQSARPRYFDARGASLRGEPLFNVAEGWEPLCTFLGVPVPETPFPHHNPRKEFWELFGDEPGAKELVQAEYPAPTPGPAAARCQAVSVCWQEFGRELATKQNEQPNRCVFCPGSGRKPGGGHWIQGRAECRMRPEPCWSG